MSVYFSNRKIKSDETEDAVSREKIDKGIFVILLIIISLVPIIVSGHMETVISPIISRVNALMTGYKGEIFTHYKMLLLLILTLVALVMFVSKLLFMNGEIRKSKLNIFISIFIFAVVVSILLSPVKNVAIWGLYNRSDGAISFLCYVVLLYIAMNIKYPKKAIQYIMLSFIPFIVINLVLTTMNFYGKDALTFESVKNVISITLPDGTLLSEGSQLMGTLNHSNYMSGIFSILTIVFLVNSIQSNRTINKIGNLILSMISLYIMLIAMSASGFVTLFIFIPLILFIVAKNVEKLKSIIILLIFIVSLASMIHVLSLQNSKVWSDSIGFFISTNPYEEASNIEELNANSFGQFNFLDTNTAYAADYEFNLPNLPENEWGPGTGRLYIYGKTLELVKDRPLFGYGLDTLVYHFPHDHIDARGNLNEVTIVDKPHNLYMGILYGTGVIGLIGFLGIVFIVSWTSLKTILFRGVGTNKYLVTLCFGWLAFAVQGLFNDSLPGITSTTFIIAGVIVALSFQELNSSTSNT